MRRILVTGATGCVGRHILPRLLERGWDVWAVRGRQQALALDNVQWRQADLLDAADVRRVVAEARPTHLLHLAWYVAPGKWAASPENVTWVKASLELLQAFKDAGGVRVVNAGSCLEYDWNYGYCSEERTPCTPHTLYGTSKHALQLLTSAMAARGEFTSAWGRIFFLYGPHEHPDRLAAAVIRSLLQGQPARTSHGRQVRDYLYVDDVAEAFVQLLENDIQGPVNIASGQPVSLKDIIERIGELTGRKELIDLGAIPPAPTDTPLVVGNVSKLTALGWTPRWDLDRGLRATIAWWQTQLAAHAQERS